HPGRQVPVDTIRRHCRSGILRTRASTPTTTSGSGTAGAELSAGDDGLVEGDGGTADGPSDEGPSDDGPSDDGTEAAGAEAAVGAGVAGGRVAAGARHPRSAARSKAATMPRPTAVRAAGLMPWSPLSGLDY
ncbi:MAG: hypothetical protein Q7V58_11040, partial [Actinomycetota bacterium]|nr:hypothetical protein [Actinomycetota bacterium]